jgi:hypothetical protein
VIHVSLLTNGFTQTPLGACCLALCRIAVNFSDGFVVAT